MIFNCFDGGKQSYGVLVGESRRMLREIEIDDSSNYFMKISVI